MNFISAARLEILRDLILRIKKDSSILYRDELIFFREYVESLGARIGPRVEAGAHTRAENENDDLWAAENSETPYDSLNDVVVEADNSRETESDSLRVQALDLLAKKHPPLEVIETLTRALRCAPTKAFLWALRAQCYLDWKKPICALRDATIALEHNPENAKALRVRGEAHRHLGHYSQSIRDLNAANAIDYDPDIAMIVKTLETRLNHPRSQNRATEILESTNAKNSQTKSSLSSQSSSEKYVSRTNTTENIKTSFKGLPPGFESLYNDPEILAAIRDPEIASVLQQITSNPISALQHIKNPKIQKIVQKMLPKLQESSNLFSPGVNAAENSAPLPESGHLSSNRKATPSTQTPTSFGLEDELD